MAVVLIVRPWGLFGKPEAPARRTPGLTVNPWRPLTARERLARSPRWSPRRCAAAGRRQLRADGRSEIAIFVIFAASLHFLMSVGGLASFGHAAYFGLGAYGVAFLAKLAGLPMIAALLLGAAARAVSARRCSACSAVRLSGVYFAMLTLAFAQIVWSIAFQWVEVTGGDNGILGVWPESWAASAGALLLAVARRRRVAASLALRVIVFSPFGYALRGDARFAAARRGHRHRRQAHAVDRLRHRRHRRRRCRRAVRLSQGQRVSRQTSASRFRSMRW